MGFAPKVKRLSGGSHQGRETSHAVLLSLDPSITLIPLIAGVLDICGLRVEADARVRPEHDVEGAVTGQSDNCHRSSAARKPPDVSPV